MTLSAQNLVLAYEQDTIVSNMSLQLNEGEITCLIGPNGCGKSTLLKALAGILSPAKGDVLLDNTPLRCWQRKALARRMAFLPQNPVAPDDITVHQLICHGRFAHQGLFGRMSDSDISAVEAALTMTNMNSLRDRNFHTLSGGERQRGWIALALAQQADILLLDEPTTFLDIGHQLEVLNLLSHLNDRHNLTVIMVLHDINQASQYADRILTMLEGQIIADDTPMKVVTPSLMKKVFGIEVELLLRQEGKKTYPCGLPLKTTA